MSQKIIGNFIPIFSYNILNQSLKFGGPISGEEVFVPVDEHLHELLVLQELNMSCSSDPRIEVLVFDFEIYIQSEQHL